MSLRCALGFHTAHGVPRWNDGYYFARCARCRVDMVRTAFGRWHVPEGYRVVWQAEPPASRPEVKLEQEPSPEPVSASPAEAGEVAEPLTPTEPAAEAQPAPQAEPTRAAEPAPEAEPGPQAEPARRFEPPQASPARPAPEAPVVAEPAEQPVKAERKRVRLPVEALLEKLRGSPDPAPAPPAPPAPSPSPRRIDWDFMMEPGERARPPVPEPVAAAKPVQAVPEPASPAAERRPVNVRSGPSIPSRALLVLRRRTGSALRHARHNKRVAQVAAVLVFAFGVAGLLWLGQTASPVRQPSDGRSAMKVEPEPPQQPDAEQFEAEQPAGEPAFVAARTLSCREAPALQARRVRVLGRGSSVRVLARDGDWVSLATARGQCWAAARYVAEVKPL